MTDIQQQIADGARPLARVDDVIAHGEAIPANVVAVRDKVDDLWGRQRGGWILTRYDGTSTTERERADTEPASESQLLLFWAPLTVVEVVEVDPEPQPAEPGPGATLADGVAALRSLIQWHLRPHEHRVDALMHLDRAEAEVQRLQGLRTAGEIDRDIVDRVADLLDIGHNEDIIGRLQYRLGEGSATPAESGPVVLSLPQVPDGAVALVGNASGRRYTPSKKTAQPDWWYFDTRDGSVSGLLYGHVLQYEHPQGVTVEFAPPREPRVWEPPDEVPEDLPGIVEVNGSRYRHAGDLTYVHELTGGMWDWWSLRGSGLVREVLT